MADSDVSRPRPQSIRTDVLGEPFETYDDCLLCDRAVALTGPGIPHSRNGGEADDPAAVEPFTTATALNAGWAWKTPLYDRVGYGYVYSSDFSTPDNAEERLRRYVGPAARGASARHLSMRVGKTRRTWIKNCVSIGLSAGFVEPLESTGLWLVEFGLDNLVRCFPGRRPRQAVVNHYNRTMTHAFEEVRDFVALHYCTTDREDSPFWRAYRALSSLPASLERELTLAREMIADSVPLRRRFFAPYSYACIFAGMEHLPDTSPPFLSYRSDSLNDARRRLADVRSEAEKLIGTLPRHRDYLDSLHDGGLQRYHDLFSPSAPSA